MIKYITDPTPRETEIITTYFNFLDKHIEEVITGSAPNFLELNQIATLLFISHTHLTDTVQKATGHHPCHFYDTKIIEQVKKMLAETNLSVAAIAHTLTYDPSNFSKFFKKMTGSTPKQWRQSNR